ncbi:4-hydroxythreonine-4-phosphate dehydrogenase [Sphingomonas jejuensis]|uniref:4-hydroxythreonine-4-phosphate dehydrogenase n=1 Tax=Sphingomonas jejuensis TaxID=904715 RepID=A0ABX0XJC1_9SPHN|nr:4-hydroxythreonine-4-phosphate dehydrogenase PdxA [Sphingomonas jejuensis]NJC33334.1 4-hydroxythreonine-4-phosphate dehydrogenase [Sphingomonas jejuensis]
MKPLAVALGDPAGIGPEIVAKAWAAGRDTGLPPFFAVGDAAAIGAVWDGPVRRISDPDEATRIFGDALPLIHLDGDGPVEPGEPKLEGARTALDSLELAAGIVRSGSAGALVTAPVAKAQLYAIGFRHPGQTEFVAERCGIAEDNAVMMLMGAGLKVVPLTTHVPLMDVTSLLSVELVVAKSRVLVRGLARNFGIERPRLAFAGLNPHAGESGKIGREELEILLPAIMELRAEGIDARGPFAADTMFHASARATYDAAICTYHDQALIPLKTIAFEEGVNMTLGLPIVRTAPDHGTAFGIAGQDKADHRAMTAAIRVAAEAAQCRARRAAA